MKKLLSLMFLFLFAPMGVAHAANEPAAAPTGEKLVAAQITGTVEEIDQQNRMITIKGPEGNLLTTAVDNDVPNLDKVKKGDKVDVTYYGTLAWSLKTAKLIPEPAKTVTTTTLVGTDDKFPFKIEAKKVDLYAKVTDLDMTNDTVTLMGPEGKSETIKVKDPANLQNVKKGDIVEINYTQAVAAQVTKK